MQESCSCSLWRNGRREREINNKIVESYGKERMNDNHTRLTSASIITTIQKTDFPNIKKFTNIHTYNQTKI